MTKDEQLLRKLLESVHEVGLVTENILKTGWVQVEGGKVRGSQLTEAVLKMNVVADMLGVGIDIDLDEPEMWKQRMDIQRGLVL